MHTSCVTEAERYEKTAAKPKKTKRNPQQEWMDIVETCASSAPSHLRDHMLTMSSLDNVPRKEKQFVNFASNSLHLRGSNKTIVAEIWSHLKRERERRLKEKEEQNLLEKKRKESNEQQQKEQQQQQKVQGSSRPNNTPEGKDSLGNCKSGTQDVTIDTKMVKKITKKTLKNTRNQSMRTKQLRKIIKRDMSLPKSAKKRLKAILLETASKKGSRIKIDGKVISLCE